jgi:hypothetical protein
MGLTALLVGAASVVLAIGGSDQAVGAATSPAPTSITAGPTDIVIQTMNSCKSAIDGAVYQLVNSAGSVVATAGQTVTSQHPGTVSNPPACPLQQGDCVSTTKGCLVFRNVPPGDYRVRQDVSQVVAADATNPAGYAPCNSGSACQWQSADVTVSPNGVLGLVTNVAPNGQVQTFPSDPSHATYFAGTVNDPILFHDFGLCAPSACPTGGNPTAVPPVPASPNQCDGDSDADDWITGSKSGQCGPSETAETGLACPVVAPWTVGFPWLCHSNPVVTPMHLQQVSLSGPATVSALSTFQVNLSGGTTPTLISAQDPGMRVFPNAAGFSVSLDPVRTAPVAAKKGQPGSPGGQVTSGQVTISPQGGQGNSLVIQVGPPSANANFIENLYHDVLGRYGFPEEVGYWSSKMDAGMLGWQMAQVFSMTPEYLGHIVDADYQYMVGAAPAASDPGRQYWVNKLNSGGNPDEIMGSLGASPAFYAQAGGTDAGFITSLYSKVLHRTAAPGAGEIQYWVSKSGPFANNQAARVQVGNDMAFSHEQHMFVAGGWYTHFLGRPGDLEGQTFWANQLDSGVMPQVGVSSFTGNGTEYYNLKAKY